MRMTYVTFLDDTSVISSCSIVYSLILSGRFLVWIRGFLLQLHPPPYATTDFNFQAANEFSSSLVFSPKAGFGRNQSPVRQPVWLWHTAF